jgi:hypothetical protein
MEWLSDENLELVGEFLGDPPDFEYGPEVAYFAAWTNVWSWLGTCRVLGAVYKSRWQGYFG